MLQSKLHLMNTSRTTSFRLHHLGKSNSVRKPSQTMYNPDESFKLAALHSVTRGVKNSDISFITGNELNKLRVEPVDTGDNVQLAAHSNLTDVRKKYDEKKKQRIQLEEKIDKLKEEHKKYQIFNQEHDGRIKEAKSKAQELENNLKEKTLELERSLMEKRVLLGMQQRHKEDKVVYDQRKYDVEKEYQYLRKQIQIFKKQGHQNGESQTRAMNVREQMEEQLRSQAYEREEHLNHLQQMEREKIWSNHQNQAREQEIKEIAQRAMQDKDLSEKQWRKISLTHLFLNKLLRTKIQKQMQKFSTVQIAFKQIKIATGVADGGTLIKKYLNKETVYGQLLSKIAQNEKKIQFLKSQTEQLIKEQKQLQIELETLQSVKIKNIALHNDIKILAQNDEKLTIATGLRNKMISWVGKQVKKLYAADQKQHDVDSQKTRQDLVLAFRNYIELLKAAMDSQELGEDVQVKQIAQLILEDNKKNTRIFILDKKEEKPNQESQLKKIKQTVFREEEVLIQSQRDDLIRMNEKFMKELKKKKDQQKKLLIQKMVEKKEKVVKAPQPKPDDN